LKTTRPPARAGLSFFQFGRDGIREGHAHYFAAILISDHHHLRHVGAFTADCLGRDFMDCFRCFGSRGVIVGKSCPSASMVN
jgi:hypothetical protein